MNKKYLILIAVVLAVGAAFLYKHNYSKDYEGSDNYASENPSASGSPTAGGTASGNRVVSTSLTYTKAVAQYANKRIQFDIYCQGSPRSAVYKNNTTVMFDNRSGDARVIGLDGVKYNFPGYGFKLITLANAKLPHTVNIDCGSAQNVMSLVIEK